MADEFNEQAAVLSHCRQTACLSVLQSEATPGEDEMNPTVKRSGWHPPEDTGLWAIADRVALEVSSVCLHLYAMALHQNLLCIFSLLSH